VVSGIFEMRIISKSVRETLNLGKEVAKNLKAGDIVCLFGELGSGKTVLTKGIALGLGINQERIVSPTFVLMRQYAAVNNIPFYHFDFYRLKACEDILVLDYEEYFYGEGITVIEWPERLKYLMPRDYLKVELSVKGEKSRSMEITAKGAYCLERNAFKIKPGLKN